MSVVTCAGLIVLDSVFSVDELPKGDGKTFATAMSESAGGPAAIGAVAAARLGSDVRLVSRLGDDARGESAFVDLAPEGIDLSFVERMPNVPTPTSAIVVDREGRRMIVNHSSRSLFASPPVDVPGALDGADAVLVDIRWPTAALAVLQQARAQRIPAVLDLDMTPDTDLDEILSAATHIVCAAPALRSLTGLGDLAEGLAQLPGGAEVAVTDGAAGVLFRDSKEVRHIPAHDVEVTNTLGAGDVFHGGVAHALAEGAAFPEALAVGNAASAWACANGGGRWGAPTPNQIHDLIRRRH